MKNDGESCPGEEKCSKSGPLARYEETAAETVCGGCKLKPTKPEDIPDELILHVETAVDLDEVKAVGGRFNYPDGLTAVEWVCIKALNNGRDTASKVKTPPKKKAKNG